MASASASFLYPSPSEAALKTQFIGKDLYELDGPAAVLDSAVIKRNCRLMLETVKKLNVGFRAHVKTHKTVELSRLQVGEDAQAVHLVASTLSEIEHLLPWLIDCRHQGKDVNVLYGLPVALSALGRLSRIASILGDSALGLFVDHPEHIKALDKLDRKSWPGQIPVWVNIDVGYHREGVTADSAQLADLATAIAASNRVTLAGLYTHLGSSYSVSSPGEALKCFAEELEGLEKGAVAFLKVAGARGTSSGDAQKVVLSLGATPTATSVQNLLDDTEGAKQYRDLLEKVNKSFAVELHAGVYPVLDMQQLATRARPKESKAQPTSSMLSYSDIAFRILVEVNSLYLDRGEKPEALISAGSIVLGREPCKSYDGWGVVSPWPSAKGSHYDPEGSKTGWIVGRISQEHGILTWEGPQDQFRDLKLGQKLLVWPNHACIAGVNFGCYVVVDTDSETPNKITDVWIRARGW